MANIIVFGPHPDDQELGMGGTIARLADQGHHVLIVDVTDGSPTPRGDRATRLIEAQEALKHLQPSAGGNSAAHAAELAKPIRRVLLDLPNRTVEHTIAARHAFAGCIRAHQASIVFAPYWEDAHPDHRAVTRIAEDARFDAKLTRIEMPVPPGYDNVSNKASDKTSGQTGYQQGPPIYPRWFFYYNCSHLRIMPQPDFIIDITGYEQQKYAATTAYRSQFGPWDDASQQHRYAESEGPPRPVGFATGRGARVLEGGEGSLPRPDGSDPSTGSSFAPGDPKSGMKTSGGLVTPDLPKILLDIGAHYGFMIGTKYGEPFYTKEPLGLTGLDGLLG